MTVKDMMTKIGDRMRAARREKGFSQTELGREIGYSMNGLAKIERGESDPALSAIMKIADALGVKLEYLLGTDQSGLIDAQQKVISNLVQRAEAAEEALKEAQ